MKTPKTLTGTELSDFIRAYCGQNNILFDADILNDGFFQRGFKAGKSSYTEEQAANIVSAIADKWHLRNIVSQFAILRPRNGVPPFAERN